MSKKMIDELSDVLAYLNTVEILSHIDLDSTILTDLENFLWSVKNEIIRIVTKHKEQEQALLNQVKWERDCAISQLEELGTSLGENPEIARQRIQEQRWISVDEALPENDGEYLCVYKSALSECNRYEILSFTTDAFRIDNYDFSRYKNKKKSLFYGYDSECGYYEWDKVIAWQPIPEYHIVEAKKKAGGAE